MRVLWGLLLLPDKLHKRSGYLSVICPCFVTQTEWLLILILYRKGRSAKGTERFTI